MGLAKPVSSGFICLSLHPRSIHSLVTYGYFFDPFVQCPQAISRSILLYFLSPPQIYAPAEYPFVSSIHMFCLTSCAKENTYHDYLETKEHGWTILQACAKCPSTRHKMRWMDVALLLPFKAGGIHQGLSYPEIVHKTGMTLTSLKALLSSLN